MKYDAEVDRAIARWAPAYGVTITPALVHAIIQQESSHVKTSTVEPPDKSGNPRMSYGPMMVLDTTAVGMGVANPAALKDPGLGIWYGVRYLAEQLQRFRGDVERAISAYNTGPGNAKRHPATGRFPNQAAYVDNVLRYWKQYKGAARTAAPAAGVLMVAAAIIYAMRRRRAA